VNQSVEPEEQPKPRAMNPLKVVGSVMAAAFGVQSSKNRERDFQQGKPVIFIAAGITFTLLFMGVVYLIVSTVLANAR
jgi:hypothetical protein